MLKALDRHRDLAPLLLRVFVGFVLVYGTQDNVFSTARMLEFRDFLAANGFPYPLACAYLSAYAQFITGVLLLLGLLTRPAAAVVVVNFLVALLMVHVGQPFNANIAPGDARRRGVLRPLRRPALLARRGAGAASVDGFGLRRHPDFE